MLICAWMRLVFPRSSVASSSSCWEGERGLPKAQGRIQHPQATLHTQLSWGNGSTNSRNPDTQNHSPSLSHPCWIPSFFIPTLVVSMVEGSSGRGLLHLVGLFGRGVLGGTGWRTVFWPPHCCGTMGYRQSATRSLQDEAWGYSAPSTVVCQGRGWGVSGQPAQAAPQPSIPNQGRALQGQGRDTLYPPAGDGSHVPDLLLSRVLMERGLFSVPWGVTGGAGGMGTMGLWKPRTAGG